MKQEKSVFPVAFLMGAAIVAVMVGGVFLLTRGGRPGKHVQARLPFAAAERAYAQQIRFDGLRMSRAANFLNQEVTFLFGSVTNEGNRSIREIEVTLEFRDSMNQVVLRDAQRALGERAAPLAPRETRNLQFTFEHIPADWNVQVPALRVTGLLLE